jgi:hypothetical protein
MVKMSRVLVEVGLSAARVPEAFRVSRRSQMIG